MRLYLVVTLLVVCVTVFTVTANPLKGKKESKDQVEVLESLRELLERGKGGKGGNGSNGSSGGKKGGKGGKKGGKGGQNNKLSSESSEEFGLEISDEEFCNWYRRGPWSGEHYDMEGREAEPIELLIADLHEEYLNARYVIRCELPYTGCNFSSGFLDEFEAMIYGMGPTGPPPTVSLQELTDSMDEVKAFLGEVSGHLSGHDVDAPIEDVTESLAALETTNYCSIVKLIPLLFKMELLGVEGAARCSNMFETIFEFNFEDICGWDEDFKQAAREDAECLKNEVEALSESTGDVSSDLSHVQFVSRFGSLASAAYRLEMDYHIMAVALHQYFKTRDEFGGSFCFEPTTTDSVVVAEKKLTDLDSSTLDRLHQLIALLKNLKRK